MNGLKYLYAMLAGAFGGAAPLAPSRRGRRPTGADLRNPADPIQGERIEAASAKRERRAKKLYKHTVFSYDRNPTTDSSVRFDPFYINL